MKNIHILATDKPSRLHEYDYLSPMGLSKEPLQWKLGRHIYITSDEEIKEGDWCYDIFLQAIFLANSFMGIKTKNTAKKIILTTDPRLAPDVQKIDDEFLEWFIKNPSCEEVEVENERIILDDVRYNFDVVEYKYKIIIPKEQPFNSKKGLKELILKDPNTCEHYKEVGCVKDICTCYTLIPNKETLADKIKFQMDIVAMDFENQVETSMKVFYKVLENLLLEVEKKQQERSYSEKDMRKAIQETITLMRYKATEFREHENTIIEQFKKK